MTNTRDEGRIVRYSFTIDFAEQDVETYPLDALAAEEVDGDREAIKAGLLATHTDAIHRAALRAGPCGRHASSPFDDRTLPMSALVVHSPHHHLDS